jgi:hypothetical protein
MLRTRSSATWTLPTSADECVTSSGEPREPYQGILAEVLDSPERLERVPLTEVRRAHELLESSAATGKLVLVPEGAEDAR